LSQRPENSNYYVVKAKQVLSAIFPDQSRISGVVKSMAQGAAIALSSVVLTSALLSIVLLVSQKSSDLVSILQAGAAVALGSFGAILSVGPSVVSLPVLGTEVSVGLHSLTIAVLTLAVVYRLSRKAGKEDSSEEKSGFSPMYLAFGFVAMTLGISYVAQGLATYTVGKVDFQGMSLISGVLVFGLVWASSYAGQSQGKSARTDFELIWKWATKAIRNFVVIYSVLIVFALIVLAVRNFIEPIYAVAQNPSSTELNFTPDQTLWVFVGIILYGANLLVNFFLMAMGINVGINLQGTQGVTELISSLDATLISNASQWTYTLLGPWAYLGVIVVVAIVSSISGARAANQLGAKFSGTLTYFKSLLTGLFVILSIVYISGVQLAVNYSPAEGETVSSVIAWGASAFGVIAFVTVLGYLVHHSAGKSFSFFATAYPRLTLAKGSSELATNKIRGARVFGLVSIAALLVVAATPIAASSMNRINALVDGPVQVGNNVSDKLRTSSISDLKKFLNPKNLRSSKWLGDKVLKAAQPAEGYNSRVTVLNGLDKPWQPGNLDATITVELEKDGKTISKVIQTTSTLENNGLLNHVVYKPVIAPTTIEVKLSKFLPKNKNFTIKLNGQTVKPSKYFAIPGVYKTEAAGYKLVADTNSTIYVENENQVVRIGYSVNLPAGADKKLQSSILDKAIACFRISNTGSSDCIKLKTLKGEPVSAEIPSDYFDFSDSKYSATAAKCSKTRKDALQTAESVLSSSECTSNVSFTRTYFKSKPKQVPVYKTESRCVGEWTSTYWETYGEVLTFRDGWNGLNYYDSNNDSYNPSGRTFQECYSRRDVTVQDGYETIQVRGDKISAVEMTATFKKKVSVKGTLLENGSFNVAK
jgi:hypothetical protein